MTSREGHTRARVQGHEKTAIDIVLQHPAISSDKQILLSVPGVCRAWRAAAQQAGTRALDLQLNLDGRQPMGIEDRVKWPPKGILQLTDFGLWLSRYAGLVRSISINSRGQTWLSRKDLEPLCKALAEPLLVLGLQTATGKMVATEQLLQLHSYCSNMLHGSAVLQALSGTGVTCLDLRDCSMASLAAALPHLLSLQSLRLQWVPHASTKLHTRVTDAETLWAALSQHSRLTHLTMTNVRNFTPVQLPVQLQELHVSCIFARHQWFPANFGHLSCLTCLVMSFDHDGMDDFAPGGPFEDAQLPAQLQELQVAYPWFHHGMTAVGAFDIAALQQLRKLTLINSQENPEQLRALNSMPQLQHLTLDYAFHRSGVPDPDEDRAAAVSAVWGQLQHLQGINISCSGLSEAGFGDLLRSLTAVTWLTQLCLSGHLRSDEEQPLEQLTVGYFKEIAKLSNLQELVFQVTGCIPYGEDAGVAAGAAHQLSALTALSKLCLMGDNTHINSLALNAIAMKLTRLQWLETFVDDFAILPVVGQLTDLRHLDLNGFAYDERVHAQFLDRLPHLTHLRVGG